jgi:hypothetical protein
MPSTNVTWKDEDVNRPFHQLFWDVWRESNYQLPQGNRLLTDLELVAHTHARVRALLIRGAALGWR